MLKLLQWLILATGALCGLAFMTMDTILKRGGSVAPADGTTVTMNFHGDFLTVSGSDHDLYFNLGRVAFGCAVAGVGLAALRLGINRWRRWKIVQSGPRT